MIDPETRRAIDEATQTAIDNITASYAPGHGPAILHSLEVADLTGRLMILKAQEAIAWVRAREARGG